MKLTSILLTSTLLTAGVFAKNERAARRGLQRGGGSMRGGGGGGFQQGGGGGRQPGRGNNNVQPGGGNNVVQPTPGVDTTPPTIGDLRMDIQADDYGFFAVVNDENGIAEVRFQLRGPTDQIINLDSTQNDDTYTASRIISSTDGGFWQVRVRAQDTANNVGVSDWTGFQVNTPDVDTATAAGVLAAAKTSIESLIQNQRTLAPKFVRLGFHDCVGGCDGCVDLGNPDNNGLDIPIDALGPIVSAYESPALGVSRADLWALAALTGAEISQPNDASRIAFPLASIGRQNCAGDMRVGPHRALPSNDLTTSGLLHFFLTNFGFNARQTVAIMGAHTLGEANRQNSGFNGGAGWVQNELRLDNDYYDELVGGNGPTTNIETLIAGPNWNQVQINNANLPNIPDRSQWVRGGGGNGGGGRGNRNLRRLQRGGGGNGGGGGGGIFMLNADISIVRDFEGQINNTTGAVFCEFRFPVESRCPYAQQTLEIAAEYKFDNGLWLEDFRDTFSSMLVHGYTEQECTVAPCTLSI